MSKYRLPVPSKRDRIRAVLAGIPDDVGRLPPDPIDAEEIAAGTADRSGRDAPRAQVGTARTGPEGVQPESAVCMATLPSHVWT